MMTNTVEILRVDWKEAEDALKHIRRSVFVEEQHVPEELEWDELDTLSAHFLARVNSTPAGTARLAPTGQIGRMAVLPPFRHRGLASSLLLAVLAQARLRGLERVFLHAQVPVVDFYHRHGFTAEGEIFLDAGIEHRAMSLILC
jgi:predicted GNAT family N-acyltransferase